MFRLWDWECMKCGKVHQDLVRVPNGKTTPSRRRTFCSSCMTRTNHWRRFPVVAKYLGDRDDSPVVHGGRFDTAGYRKGPKIPKMPGEVENEKACSDAVAALPENATYDERKKAVMDAAKHGPGLADYVEHWKRPDVKHAFDEKIRIRKENKEKQRRLEAKRRGENVSFRHTKCQGDPNFKG